MYLSHVTTFSNLFKHQTKVFKPFIGSNTNYLLCWLKYFHQQKLNATGSTGGVRAFAVTVTSVSQRAPVSDAREIPSKFRLLSLFSSTKFFKGSSKIKQNCYCHQDALLSSCHQDGIGSSCPTPQVPWCEGCERFQGRWRQGHVLEIRGYKRQVPT